MQHLEKPHNTDHRGFHKKRDWIKVAVELVENSWQQECQLRSGGPGLVVCRMCLWSNLDSFPQSPTTFSD